MNVPPEYVGEYQRCILELDVPRARRVWWKMAPHLYQPADDAEMLFQLHATRAQDDTMPSELRRYSQAWLDEREKRVFAYAVGVSVGSPPERQHMAQDIENAMVEAVQDSYNAGLDLNEDAVEVHSRMQRAKASVLRITTMIRGRSFPGTSA